MKTYKMHYIFFIIALVVAGGGFVANASQFKDTSRSTKPITIGLRFGINSSSQGINFSEVFPDTKQAHTEWKTGFDVGAVVNLNLNQFITIQPGFFFQNRSYDYTIINANFNEGYLSNRFGHTRNYSFQIPILLSLGFNLSEDIRWNIDLGPYFTLGLGGFNKVTHYYTQVGATNNIIANNQYERDYYDNSTETVIGMKSFDWGLKFGTSLTFKNHFNLGFHYMTGLKNIANQHSTYQHDASSKSKSWTISIGYDF